MVGHIAPLSTAQGCVFFYPPVVDLAVRSAICLPYHIPHGNPHTKGLIAYFDGRVEIIPAVDVFVVLFIRIGKALVLCTVQISGILEYFLGRI